MKKVEWTTWTMRAQGRKPEIGWMDAYGNITDEYGRSIQRNANNRLEVRELAAEESSEATE